MQKAFLTNYDSLVEITLKIFTEYFNIHNFVRLFFCLIFDLEKTRKLIKNSKETIECIMLPLKLLNSRPVLKDLL